MSALPGSAPLDPSSLAHAAAVALLLLARLLPVAWLVPWALVRSAPASLPLALTVVLAICIWPGAAAHAQQLSLDLPALFPLLLRELLIGAVHAFALALPLRALEWGGWLQGRFSGLAGAEQSLASLQLWLGLAAFFALGGHRLATAALAQSVISHPLGRIDPLPDLAAIALGSARMIGDAFATALQLALPLAAALGLSELALGLCARVVSAPWFPPAIAPARALLSMFVIWIGTRALLGTFPQYFRHGLSAAQKLWEAL